MQTATDTFPALPLTIDLPKSLNRASQESDRTSWYHRIVLRPSTLEIEVWSEYGNGTPEELWHDLVIQLGAVPDGTADLSEVRDCLQRHETQIRDLADMHTVEWRGGHYVGTYSDPDLANRLMQQVSDAIDALELPRFWDAGEYYAPVTPADVIPADFAGTDEAFEALADREIRAAVLDAVHLERDTVLRTLRGMWERLLEERAEEADEAE